MWTLTNNPRAHKVTHKLAKEFADMDAVPQDRPLSERRLQVYERMVHEGAFRPCVWAKAFCVETNQHYRVNGKHTSILFSSLELEHVESLYVIIEEYRCETLEDVARLYATFDSKMQTRTASDIYRAFAATVPQLAELPRLTLNLLVAGVAADFYGIRNYLQRQAAERAELLLDNIDFATWANSILTPQDAYILRRVPVIAAMCGTYGKAKKAAEEFWLAVRDQSASRNDHPTRRLAKFLMITNADGAPIANRRQRHVGDTREFYVRSLHAWNAWRKGEPTVLQYFKNAKIPSIS